jgi:NDP-sugar pyrophosphorylase family protein
MQGLGKSRRGQKLEEERGAKAAKMMASKGEGPCASPKWAAVVLAAGYGTRLAADLQEEAEAGRPMGELRHLPKALLPCDKAPLLDHWLYLFRRKCGGAVDTVLVVTNDLFFPALSRWAQQRGIPAENVLANGTATNETRRGACADLAFALERRADAIQDRHVLVVASDLLFTSACFDLEAFLFDTAAHACAACLWYTVPEADVRKRGILEVDEISNVVTSFMEKPEPSATTSRKACPPLYSFAPRVARLLQDEFLPGVRQSSASAARVLAEIDAPGKFISWLAARDDVTLVARPVSGRFDIGNLAQYREALAYYSNAREARLAHLPLSSRVSCPARVGLVGNPSDQFGGKVLAMTLANFEATVRITANADPQDQSVTIVGHAGLNSGKYPQGLEQLLDGEEEVGGDGGVRLFR